MRIPGLTLQLDADALEWRETRTPGVRWYLLHSEQPDEASGRRKPSDTTALIRMEPGCGYPPHKHLDIEEVFVLAGGYGDERGQHVAGDYVRYAAGSVHAPIASGDPSQPVGPENPACVLFAIARGGIELE